MTVDWLAIKSEYISTNISLRKLAEKYDVSFSTLGKKAVNEKWKEDRAATFNKMATKTKQKVVAAVATQEADRIVRLLSISDKLTERLNLAADQLDQMVVRHKKKHRIIEYGDKDAMGKPTKEVIDEEEILDVVDAPIDRQGLQQLSVALKNIRDVSLTGQTDEDAMRKLDKLIEGITDAAKP